jgi:hypothetical protein
MSHFNAPQKSIDWAKECIDRGRLEFGKYVNNDAFSLVIEDDVETGEKVTKIALVKDIPASVEGLFRNALVDLKHSFDQSLFAAAQSMSCIRFDRSYPWADSLIGLSAIIKTRQKDAKTRLPDVIINEIFRQEPHSTRPTFIGGNDFIRDIAKLVNDKHTIGFDIAASVETLVLKNFTTNGPSSLAGKWDSIKKEIEICRVGIGGSVSHDHPSITSNIFFKRTGNIGKVPVPVAAMEFADKAQFVLDGFKVACT